LVQYGGKPVRCVPLEPFEHGICVGIGAFSLIVGLIIKAVIPSSWFNRLNMKEDPLTQEEIHEAFTT